MLTCVLLLSHTSKKKPGGGANSPVTGLYMRHICPHLKKKIQHKTRSLPVTVIGRD